MADKKKVNIPMWKNRPILDEEHAADLEQRAALHEFEGKLPTEMAEQKAHDDYRKDHHEKAAASHFSGMKAAKASGDNEEAQKHHMMYKMHLKQLGHDSNGPIPEQVSRHIEASKREPYYTFKPHKADALLFEGNKKK